VLLNDGQFVAQISSLLVPTHWEGPAPYKKMIPSKVRVNHKGYDEIKQV
jgi:hypothetical protein